jgi:hypothetical protein
MRSKEEKLMLVGDNPFHGISHLSQERVRSRGYNIADSKFAADIVSISIKNGANGFMFSVSGTTLDILKNLRNVTPSIDLYALVPYAYEYVRMATHAGGISGITTKLAKEIAFSNLKVGALGIKGIIKSDLEDIFKAYLSYEIWRITDAAGQNGRLRSVFLHEIITDMALALKLEWVFDSFIKFIKKRKIKPGFETRNYAYLVNQFKIWNINLSELLIAAPFNKVGFYMNPSRDACEKALLLNSYPNTIAMSILAAGYLKLPEAVEYISGLPNISGVVVGVSKEHHAHQTFDFLKNY